MRPFSPPPPTPSADIKEVFTSTLWQRWFSALSTRVAACLVKDSLASVPAASAVATTVYTLPAAGTGTFMVTCNIGAVGSVANYGAFAIVAKDLSTSRLVLVSNSALQTITVAGLAVQSTQSSGSPQTIQCTVVQIG